MIGDGPKRQTGPKPVLLAQPPSLVSMESPKRLPVKQNINSNMQNTKGNQNKTKKAGTKNAQTQP